MDANASRIKASATGGGSCANGPNRSPVPTHERTRGTCAALAPDRDTEDVAREVCGTCALHGGTTEAEWVSESATETLRIARCDLHRATLDAAREHCGMAPHAWRRLDSRHSAPARVDGNAVAIVVVVATFFLLPGCGESRGETEPLTWIGWAVVGLIVLAMSMGWAFAPARDVDDGEESES